MTVQWEGVMPATTTAFDEDYNIDHGFIAEHARWLIENGCTALVPHGSLGEGATLSFREKVELQQTYVKAAGEIPVIPGIAALSTKEAIEMARAAEENGCRGLMVLPPYVYCSDWREMKSHVASVISATNLPCMLYNNPVAYGTDFTPAYIKELADEHPNLQAVKESSGDVRRVAAILERCGDRLTVGVGLDDYSLEGATMGAKFWIAGVVNALPKESVKLWKLGRAGKLEEAMPLYRGLLPLLRMDTEVKFVQLIKLIQSHLGRGNIRVRPPRLELEGQELESAESTICKVLENQT